MQTGRNVLVTCRSAFGVAKFIFEPPDGCLVRTGRFWCQERRKLTFKARQSLMADRANIAAPWSTDVVTQNLPFVHCAGMRRLCIVGYRQHMHALE